MRRLFIITVLVFATMSANAGKIITENIKSRILGANIKVNVYVPSQFENSNDHYPVVYLLHGLSDTYRAWEQKGGMKEIADELIDSGEVVPMVIVMPNAGGEDVHDVWNGYFNMPEWNYEDFFFKELMPQMEAKYRCGGKKQLRAVMGLSMGGGGSVVYAQQHPDKFSSCYAMSPWLISEGGVMGPDGEMDKMYFTSQSVKENSAFDFLENADEPVREKLRSVKWFLDCGDDDMLVDDTFALYQQMKMVFIGAELRIRNGNHNWEYWRASLRMALPFASRNFNN